MIPNDNVMVLLEKTRNRFFYEISIVIAEKHSEHSGVGHLFSPYCAAVSCFCQLRIHSGYSDSACAQGCLAT